MGIRFDLTDKEGREAFLQASWEMLAWFAYKSYKQQGRGTVWIKDDPQKAMIEPPQFLLLSSESISGDLKVSLEEYLPEEEIVVFFEITGSPLIVSTVEGVSKPPIAFAAFEKRMGNNQEPSGGE